MNRIAATGRAKALRYTFGFAAQPFRAAPNALWFAAWRSPRAGLKPVLLFTGILCAACADVGPAPFDSSYACATCRMVVSDVHFAAQIVAPGEEPRFYDDIGCLGRALAAGNPPDGAVAFVADHRTGAWVKAESAIYTRAGSLATPMGSHLIAHADASSRDQDPAAQGGAPVATREALGAGAAHAK